MTGYHAIIGADTNTPVHEWQNLREFATQGCEAACMLYFLVPGAGIAIELFPAPVMRDSD